jgi:hypothetical protein
MKTVRFSFFFTLFGWFYDAASSIASARKER